MKIGRNDPCPCGSGKKYKHCCLLKKSMSTGDLIRAAVQNAGYKEDIANVLCNLSEYMNRKQWWGACHIPQLRRCIYTNVICIALLGGLK